MCTSAKLVAIAIDGVDGLDCSIGAHFARCAAYALVSVDEGRTVDLRIMPNPFVQGREPGQIPRYLQSLGANVVIAGGMGPRANAMFEAFGIEVVSGLSGTAKSGLDRYLSGQHGGFVPCEDHASGQQGRGCKDHAD